MKSWNLLLATNGESVNRHAAWKRTNSTRATASLLAVSGCATASLLAVFRCATASLLAVFRCRHCQQAGWGTLPSSQNRDANHAAFHLVLVVACCLSFATSALAAEPDWVATMRSVHQNDRGDAGVLLHLGDSITYSMAYFAPLQYAKDAKMSAETRAAWTTVDGYIKQECYRWKGGEKGNYSGQTAAWGLKNVDGWIAEWKPEAAVIMFGTNDIRRGSIESHADTLRALVQRCLDSGVVVILSTIPPMHGFDEKVEQAVEAQRKIAAEMHLPLIDFYAHVINRRPKDWDGALPPFASFGQWDVPTLISRDGVHPSNPAEWKNDFTEEGLCRNGNILRSYLTMMAYAEVINVVFKGQSPSGISSTILGAKPPKPTDAIQLESPSPTPDENTAAPSRDWFPQAPPLPKPAGPVIRVANVAELYAATEAIGAGGTISVADGVYRMPQTFYLKTDGVTLRGESGDRTKVVLDFANCRHHEGVAVSHCSDVTIADLTIQNVRQNGIKINSNLDVDRVTVYNVVSHNVWQRHIKGPGVPDRDGQPDFVHGCRVQYCLFYNDRPKRRGDEPWEDSNPGMGFNYIGGMDIMNANGWTIADNVFMNINGQTGEARGAVFLWHNGTDCVIERNIMIDCDSGICLGNSSARGEQRHANGMLVRNNFIVRCQENNILADHTRNCRIEHNTVHDPETRTGRLLRAVHANDGLVVVNNLFSGPRIVVEQTEGELDIRNNLIRPVVDWFQDAAAGDLHLTEKATDAFDRAIPSSTVTEDFDRQSRGSQPDLGADEFTRGTSATGCLDQRRRSKDGMGLSGLAKRQTT